MPPLLPTCGARTCPAPGTRSRRSSCGSLSAAVHRPVAIDRQAAIHCQAGDKPVPNASREGTAGDKLLPYDDTDDVAGASHSGRLVADS